MGNVKVLYVEQNMDGTIGGSHYCLLDLVESLTNTVYRPEAVFYERHSLWDEFARCCNTFLFKKPRRLRRPKHFPLMRRCLNLGLLCRDVGAITKFLRHQTPDIVHLNNSFCVGFDTWGVACRLLGIPLLTFERACSDPSLIKRPLHYIWLITKVLCVSDAVRKHYVSLGMPPDKLTTVYDGIDAERIRSRVDRRRADVRREFGLSEAQPVVGMVGNIRRWKGQHVLINAIAKVKYDMPDVHCLLIGATGSQDHEYFQEIAHTIREKSLEAHVTVTGYRTDVPNLLNSVDVQVHASTAPDPFPRVILEGMSLGIPVIASASGGVTESVTHGTTGFLYAPSDDDELAVDLRRLLGDSALRKQMGAAGRTAVERFSMRNHVSAVAAAYSETLSRQTGKAHFAKPHDEAA